MWFSSIPSLRILVANGFIECFSTNERSVCEPAVLETASCVSSASLMSSMLVSADPGSSEAPMQKGLCEELASIRALGGYTSSQHLLSVWGLGFSIEEWR